MATRGEGKAEKLHLQGERLVPDASFPGPAQKELLVLREAFGASFPRGIFLRNVCERRIIEQPVE